MLEVSRPTTVREFLVHTSIFRQVANRSYLSNSPSKKITSFLFPPLLVFLLCILLPNTSVSSSSSMTRVRLLFFFFFCL